MVKFFDRFVGGYYNIEIENIAGNFYFSDVRLENCTGGKYVFYHSKSETLIICKFKNIITMIPNTTKSKKRLEEQT